MAVSVGNFRLTTDDPKFPIPSDSNAAQTLWLVVNNTLAGTKTGVKAAPPQHVRVVVTNNNGTGSVHSDKDYVVGSAGTSGTGPGVGVDLPKGTNLATVTFSENGPSDQRIGFYLG